jgi:hypothetical protein
MKTKTRIAIAQAPPIFMDLDQSMQKARDLIRDAACQAQNSLCFLKLGFLAIPRGLNLAVTSDTPHRVVEIVYAPLAFTQSMES